VADAVVTEYRKLGEESEREGSEAVLSTLATQQMTLQMQIDGLIKTRFNISKKLGADSPEQLRAAMSRRASELEATIHDRLRQKELLQATSRPADAELAEQASRLGKEIELLEKDLDWQRSQLATAGDVAM